MSEIISFDGRLKRYSVSTSKPQSIDQAKKKVVTAYPNQIRIVANFYAGQTPQSIANREKIPTNTVAAIIRMHSRPVINVPSRKLDRRLLAA